MSTPGSSRRPPLPPQQPQASQNNPPQTSDRAATNSGPAAAPPPEVVDRGVPPGRKEPGSSSGAILAAGMALDTQATVIARPGAPALAEYSPSSRRVHELGMILEGKRLGHFDLLEYVGGGGMGAVFRGLDTMLNRVVAVKVLSQQQSTDEEMLRRFKNEAQSAARLSHENISRVYYVGEDRGWHYIVFEFIEGTNLRDLVEHNGPLKLESAVSYTVQIADALAHASRRDVVHRDIKPSNVLVTPDDRAKLVDMGLARLHQVELSDDLTASGVTLGTFDYISPEQARDPRNADVRSDIYSLGCTLYFMLTGRPPFPEGTVLQKLLQHQGDEPPDLRIFRSDLPDDFFPILDQMLSKTPAKRFQTPDELVAALTALAHRHGLKTTAPAGLVWLSPDEVQLSSIEKHLPWLVPLVALVIIVAMLSLIWSVGSEPTGPPPLGANAPGETLPPKAENQPAPAKEPPPTVPSQPEEPSSESAPPRAAAELPESPP